MNLKDKKVALVHDFLLYRGGAENVLRELAEIFPEAPIYTLLKNEKFCQDFFPGKTIKTSFLQNFPKFLRKRQRFLLPLMPTAVETFDLRDYDLVISSSAAFAKGLVVKTKTQHLAYIHAPMRYVWDWQHEYLQEKRLKGKVKLVTRFLLNYLRLWDRASASRPDLLVANSRYTQKRIEKYYRRSSEVIYPPVEVERFKPQKEHQGYFLTVGRLSGYKRVDLIVDAFLKLKLPLKVVGSGSELERLKKQAGANSKIEFLDKVDDEEIKAIYQNCRAFICASEDDFNITAVEAMAAGKPVIALRAGGLQETVLEGKTGEFFDEPVLELLADGVRRFMEKEAQYNPNEIRKRAEQFSREKFRNEIRKLVDRF